MAYQFYQTHVNFYQQGCEEESDDSSPSTRADRPNMTELDEIAIDSVSVHDINTTNSNSNHDENENSRSVQLHQNNDGAAIEPHALNANDSDSSLSEDSESAPMAPRSYLNFQSQEHAFIQEVFPEVPDDLVNVIREYTQIELTGDVTASEAEYAQQANVRPTTLKPSAFFVLFGFTLVMGSMVFFALNLKLESPRWGYISLVIPGAVNMLAVSSTSEIWSLHIRAAKMFRNLRAICWIGLLIELVSSGTASVYLYVPLLIESLGTTIKAINVCYFSQKPPFALVHIGARLNAVTFWTVDSSANSSPDDDRAAGSRPTSGSGSGREDQEDSEQEPTVPTAVKFKLAAWYPLDRLCLTMYTAHDKAWHAYSVAKIEVAKPLKYGHGGKLVKENMEVTVLVPREVQNIVLAKQHEFSDFLTLIVQRGGLWSGDKRPVLLTDMYRAHILDRDGYLGHF